MSQFEKQLRSRVDVDRLVGTRIKTIEEGKLLMEEINTWSKKLLQEMIDKDLNNEQEKAYSDMRYDLKTAKQRIGSQLTALVKAKIASRK